MPTSVKIRWNSIEVFYSYSPKTKTWMVVGRKLCKIDKLCPLTIQNHISASRTLNWGGSLSWTPWCILRHRGVQLILAYSSARPAILVAGKGRGGMFLLCPRHFQWGGGGVPYSITAVRTYVRPVRPIPFVPYLTLLVSVRYLLKGWVFWIKI